MLLLMDRSSFLDSSSYIPSIFPSLQHLANQHWYGFGAGLLRRLQHWALGTLSVFGRTTTETGNHGQTHNLFLPKSSSAPSQDMQGSQLNKTHTLQKFTIVDLSLQQAFTANKSTFNQPQHLFGALLLWPGSGLHGTIL